MTVNVNEMTADSGELLTAALAAMGASGSLRSLPHAQLAYDPASAALCIALDYYSPDDISATWQAVYGYVRAAGLGEHVLEIPGDRELFRTASGGSLADFHADAVMGQEWPNGAMTWRLSAPLAPWEPEA